jgi:FkbM family methyltransferase
MTQRGAVHAIARSVARRIAKSTFWREGSVRRILRGPSAGLKYRIFGEYGLGPAFGTWEVPIQRLLLSVLRRGDIAYDLGANYGLHTLTMARAVGSEGCVFAFEPVPELARATQHNADLNHFDCVRVIESAVSDVSGFVDFEYGADASRGHLTGPAQPSPTALRVACLTLDEFVFLQGHPQPIFLKIDVEGAEGSVLLGGVRVLAEARPLMLVELHSPEASLAVGQILADQGYRAYRAESGEVVGSLTTAWPDGTGLWGHILAVPSEQTGPPHVQSGLWWGRT